MTWLLDVSTLVAYVMKLHVHHDRVAAWRRGKTIAVCPITELGFLRVSCALGWAMSDSRSALTDFLRDEAPIFIPCDRRVLDGMITLAPRKTTDIYLAELATSRGWRFATLDTGIAHPAADLIPVPVEGAVDPSPFAGS